MITLQETIQEAINNPDLVAQYERLKKVKLFQKRTPIETLIDEATGYHGLNEKDLKEFFDFVRDYIWLPLLTKETK